MDLNKFMKNLKGRKIKKDQILILFLAGILLLVIAIPTGRDEREDDMTVYEEGEMVSAQDSMKYTQYLERKLANVLSKMEGVGKADVMITLSSSAEQVVEKDLEVEDESVTESDSQGGTRMTNQSSRSENTIYDGEGSNPYVSKEISPKVGGVVVIAEGGNNAVVVKNITESVQALFGIDSHKIRIVKRGG